MKRFLALCTALVWLAVCFPAAAEPQKYSRSMLGIFDTEIILQGYCESQADFDRAADGLAELLTEYDKIFDAYHSYSGVNNLWYVNRSAGTAPVEIPDALFELLAWCKAQWESGRRETNVALGAVLSIWHDYRTAGLEDPSAAQLPPMEALEAAAEHTDFDQVILDAEASTVFFADPLITLDVGAVAKGFAADKAQAYLSTEMPSFLLSLGGNVVVGQPPQDGRAHWGVSVQDPNAALLSSTPGTDILDILYVDSLSVVTSGDYWRFYVVDGQRYHHIIDPKTLMPAAYLRQVTVVCESSLLADFLSTALFTLPYEEGRSLVDSLPGVEAIWALPDGTVKLSGGMARYAYSQGATAYGQ